MTGRHSQHWRALAIAAPLLLTWCVYFLYGERLVTLAIERRLPKILSFFANSDVGEGTPDLLTLRYALIATSIAYLVGAFVWQLAPWRSLTSQHWDTLRYYLVPLLVWAGCTYTCLRAFAYQAREMPWNGVDDVMTFSVGPPVRHRILFPLIALGIKHAFPSASNLRCFLISQSVAIGLIFIAIRKWAELFVEHRHAQLAPLLLLAMIVPTFGYYTFYDVGIVLLFTLGLILLFRDRMIAYLCMFAIGTLNHEVMLVLALASIPILQKRSGIASVRTLGLIVAQLSLYAGVRWVLFTYLPVSRAWSPGRIWFNMDLILHHPFVIAQGTIPTLAPWWGLAILGLPYAPAALRPTLILVPALLATTFVMGQFNEPRQFDALIPVVVVFALCGLVRGFAVVPSNETPATGVPPRLAGSPRDY